MESAAKLYASIETDSEATTLLQKEQFHKKYL